MAARSEPLPPFLVTAVILWHLKLTCSERRRSRVQCYLAASRVFIYIYINKSSLLALRFSQTSLETWFRRVLDLRLKLFTKRYSMWRYPGKTPLILLKLMEKKLDEHGTSDLQGKQWSSDTLLSHVQTYQILRVTKWFPSSGQTVINSNTIVTNIILLGSSGFDQWRLMHDSWIDGPRPIHCLSHIFFQWRWQTLKKRYSPLTLSHIQPNSACQHVKNWTWKLLSACAEWLREEKWGHCTLTASCVILGVLKSDHFSKPTHDWGI